MTKFARKCSLTGMGMNSGWTNEEFYIKDKEHAVAKVISYIREEVSNGGDYNIDLNKASDDDVLEFGYNHYGIYYTEWEEVDNDEWYDENGEVYTTCGNCGEETALRDGFDICHNCLNQL